MDDLAFQQSLCHAVKDTHIERLMGENSFWMYIILLC